MSKKIKKLPITNNVESKNVLRALVKATKAISLLKGYSELLPNKSTLINAILLNESKNSSAIENIITTHDDLFDSLGSNTIKGAATKEVLNYKEALWQGYNLVKSKGFLTTNMIVEIQEIVEENKGGIRKLPGTKIVKDVTGEVVYTPPQSEDEIRALLGNLELFMNRDEGLDDLVKLAMIHYQFEAIHPFYDGNGRTGRIINVLYLVQKGILDTPILYLSKYINETRSEYYKLLNEVTTKDNWEEWIIYLLIGVEKTATYTLDLVKEINNLLEETKVMIKLELPKIYSSELIDSIFSDLYTKIGKVSSDLGVTRKTAANYLTTLENKGFLRSKKIGKDRIFYIEELHQLISSK